MYVCLVHCIWQRKDALPLLPLPLKSGAGVHGQDPVVFLCFFKHSIPTRSRQCLWQFIPQSTRQRTCSDFDRSTSVQLIHKSCTFSPWGDTNQMTFTLLFIWQQKSQNLNQDPWVWWNWRLVRKGFWTFDLFYSTSDKLLPWWGWGAFLWMITGHRLSCRCSLYDLTFTVVALLDDSQ